MQELPCRARMVDLGHPRAGYRSLLITLFFAGFAPEAAQGRAMAGDALVRKTLRSPSSITCAGVGGASSSSRIWPAAGTLSSLPTPAAGATSQRVCRRETCGRPTTRLCMTSPVSVPG